MNRKIFVFELFIMSVIYSCNKVAQPLTREEIKQKADSISNIRIRQADEQAKTDLEYRMKIEVRVKVDSIIAARMKSTFKDTIKKSAAKKDALKLVPGKNLSKNRDVGNKSHSDNRRKVQGGDMNIEVGTNKRSNITR